MKNGVINLKTENLLSQVETVRADLNMNPLGVPESVTKAIADNMSQLSVYPDHTTKKLKEAISAYSGANTDDIIVGGSSYEFVKILCEFTSPKKAILITPGAQNYEKLLSMNGCEIIYYSTPEEEDFTLDIADFIGRDEKLQRVYDTLGMSLSIGQAMEEFLVYTHKKRALTLSVAQNDLLVEMPSELVRASVTITKNTWGYTNTKIASDCDFLIPETSVLKWNSFDGNTFDLSFLIDPQKIHDGESSGYIYIWNTYQNMRIQVSIRKPEVIKMTPKSRQTRFTIKRAEEALIRAYIDFRTDKIDLKKYIAETRDALNTLIKYRPEYGMYRLGLLHMQILEGHTEFVEQEFLRIDADANFTSMEDMEKCYLSYLKSLLRREKFIIDRTAAMVRERFEANDKNRLFYFWILLFVDVNYTEDKWVLYEDIQKLFNSGVNSPVIYFEICDMFNKQPLMMKKIAPLEIAALRWGMRNEFVSEDVIVEFVKTAS